MTTERTSAVPVYSFVIPILDEEETLHELYRRVAPVMDQMDGPCEMLIVDDGSTDGSFAIVEELERCDPRVRALRLSRNFGHQIALTAGVDASSGDAVIVMDADLQDPPEVVLELAKRWREGYDVVYAVREAREGETRFKRATARWFYRVLGRMSEVPMPFDAGDFRLVDRSAVDAIGRMREHHRYIRGMFSWVGFRHAAVHYRRAARHAGRSKFSMRKMTRFAADGIVSFSSAPLRVVMPVGFALWMSSFLAGLVLLVLKVAGAYAVPVWLAIVVGVLFLTGIQLTVLGVMGAYVGRIYDEVKQRPLYLLRDTQPPGTSTLDLDEVPTFVEAGDGRDYLKATKQRRPPDS
jgi:polyisoprenyl-phosphate glycosyltransferase